MPKSELKLKAAIRGLFLNSQSAYLRTKFLSRRSIAWFFLNKSVGFRGGLSPSKKIVFIYFNVSSLRKMKVAFYFMLEVLFDLEVFWLCRKTA